MKRIGLLSDTHGIVPKQVYEFFNTCDEIWHAGDIGNNDVLEELRMFKPLQAVYGNMDGWDVRHETQKVLLFTCEEIKVMMTHIGGYPGKYEKNMISLLEHEKPNLYITGHSHILKVMYDKKYNLLHINPGAAGKQGFHTISTMIRFTIEGNTPKELEVLEYPKI